MKNGQKPSKKQIAVRVAAASLLALSVASNGFLLYRLHKADAKPAAAAQPLTLNIDAQQSMTQIESYLDAISPAWIADVQQLAKTDGIPSWGCGPSSYSLGKIINQKFFNNQLKIAALYNSDTANQYEIVERFGLHQDASGNIIDHAWLEIYYQNQFLFIDPTIGQFGQPQFQKIAYQTFTVGDPTISATLKSQYGIVDINLKRLVQKEVNRLPADQEPYPGVSISQATLNYYIQVEADRNDVNDGTEPSDWTTWDKALIGAFPNQS